MPGYPCFINYLLAIKALIATILDYALNTEVQRKMDNSFLNEENNDNSLEPEKLAYSIVNINSRLVLDDSEVKIYKCADIVKHIIEFDSSIEWSINTILKYLSESEKNGYTSDDLSELKELTRQYQNALKEIKDRANRQCLELAEKTLKAHSIQLDVESEFEVDGYQFKATPISQKINFIVSDLFSPSDIANINMPLVEVTVTGNKKSEKHSYQLD